MTIADIHFGMGLSASAGWNQTEADWRMLLENSSAGSFVACYNGVEAGTVTTVTYSRCVHWIGMVLVAPQYRRKGIGTAMVEGVLKSLRGRGTFYLDATPQGIHLYERLGFEPVYPLARSVRTPAYPPEALATLIKEPAQQPTTPELLPGICLGNCHGIFLYDEQVFGADRSQILASLSQRKPGLTFAKRTGGSLRGFCMTRFGCQYIQVGPLLADDLPVASDLLLVSLARYPGKEVIIDSGFSQPGWNVFIKELGFQEVRPFMRMRLGDEVLSGARSRQFAIAGPEIG